MGSIGEAGSITANFAPENVEREVVFDRPIENAVISLTGTNSGGNQYTFRITEVTDTGFKFIVDEWDYLDGPHGATETINWFAIEEGEHFLPDGRMISAGYATATDSSGSVAFDTPFGTPPVVLTTALAGADINQEAVDSDPFLIDENGFELRLQEEEANDGVHGPETVGWIAIEPGGDGSHGSAITHENFDESNVSYGLGATYDDAIVVAETQTLEDDEAANIEIRSNLNNPTTNAINLRLREERSQDNELNHQDEVLGLAAFERGLIFCFTPGAMIDTPMGRRPVECLKVGDLVTTQRNGAKPIAFIARRKLTAKDLAAAPHLRPVLIRKGALGDNAPDADMKVSPQHRMLIESADAEVMFGQPAVLAPALALVNGKMIRVAKGAKSVEYIHILFDQHEIVFANGAPTESLYPGGQVQDGLEQAARDELFEIFPDLATGGVWRMAESALRPFEARAIAEKVVERRPPWRARRAARRRSDKALRRA